MRPAWRPPQVWRSPRACIAATAGLALVAALVADAARDVVFDLGAEAPERSVQRFVTGARDVVVEARAPWAAIPRILPGPDDAWAGGVAHAVMLALEGRPTRRHTLYLHLDDAHALSVQPRWARRDAPAPPDPVAPARLTVAVNGGPLATIEPRFGAGGAAPQRFKFDIPAEAFRQVPRVVLSIQNGSGGAVALEHLRLVEAVPTFAWAHLRRHGRFPPESAVFLLASLAVLALGQAGVARERTRMWWLRTSVPAAALLLLLVAELGPAEWPLDADVPRWGWLALPWLLLLLVPPRRTPTELTPARVRALLLNATVALAALGVSLVAAELVLRVAFRGVASARDARAYFSRPQTELNALGFREREVHPDKPPHTYRVAVLGDSLAWGIGVPAGHRFSNLVERALSERARPGLTYEVLNFAVSGWDTNDELEALRAVAWTLRPDFVLLQWYVNDFELSDRVERPAPAFLTPWDRLNGLLLQHSALFSLLQEQWAILQEKLGLVETYVEYMYARFGDPEGPHSLAAIATLRSFLEECRRHRTPVAIVLFPHVDADLSAGRYRYGYLHDRVLDLCRREETPCVDLRATFAAYRDYRQLWVTRLDPHPSALAHRLAADELIGALAPLWLAGPAGRR